jgi:serine protease
MINPGGTVVLEPGQRPVTIHPTVEAMAQYRKQLAHQAVTASASTTNDLYYHGGTGGIGVETAPKVYLVLWGSQWTNNDPSGEANILQNFYNGVGGSSWNNSVTQYCQGVASGTYTCGTSGQHAGNPTGMLAGVWFDTGVTAPSRPSQSQIATEAQRAAGHFGGLNSNTVQYVIAAPHGVKPQGFGTQYCAWHSSTSSSYGTLAYTNLPYITDAGSSCGANFNGLGPNAGITIVGGHEMAETETDQFPNGGWLDSGGSENGDKCAWIQTGNQGASANVSFSTGTFPVQSLWSNAFNSGSGGCVLSY